MQSQFYRRCFQIVFAAVIAWLLYEILLPLRAELGWAAVLAFILHPLHEALSRRLKGRRALSAGILTGLTPFLVLAPLAVLGAVFAGQVAHVIESLRGRTILSGPEIIERLSAIPLIGGAIDWARENASVSLVQVQGWMDSSLQALLERAAAAGGGVALGVFGTLVGFFMMLFMLYFFLQDGRAMLTALEHLIPTTTERRHRLLDYLASVTRAVVFGSVATAFIQGIIVGIGFAIAKLPSPVVFGVLGVIAAFLPSGSAIVLIPAAIYLAFAGRWGAAIFIGCWTVGMWLLENLLRPLLTSRHMEVSTLAIFVGAIGGASAFGILGLIIGPVVLSFAVALARYMREQDQAEA
ncbi:MAG TPA: AI-2E family transporter [Steroidobacteraceae bacterium]|nr:AI-2E family transporter [Steroidobacteraceae bacterium]